jgi:octaprenyl-diphosphate synthase
MIQAFAGLEPHFAAVEQHMAQALRADELRVDRLINELGTFHGKMLRPALILLVARALGPIDDLHTRLGAALEMIHTATLIHDDLIDDADVRRGLPTAHVKFGNTTSVLLGDYFYTHAFSLVAAARLPEVMQRLVETTNVICRGELHQQCAARDAALTEAEYERIIFGKTACLTELAAEFGAVHGTPAQRAAAAAYGLACGMAFQIVDDCLDFTGDPAKVGKTLATDIERGRMTLPILRLLADASPAERVEHERHLQRQGTPDEVAAFRATVVRSGALASALSTAKDHVRRAQSALSAFPAGEARDQLSVLADFIVARDF